MSTLRVFLVDDHPVVRDGLTHLLQTAGFTVSGEADSAQAALAHPALSQSSLIVVDISLGEGDGVELIRQLCELGKKTLVYSMHEDASTIRHALRAGANGYVTKREAASSLAPAIAAIANGAQYLSLRAATALKEPSELDTLSGQQREIYCLLGQGYANEEIARQLGISVRTLESYCVRIIDKLALETTKALRQHAIRRIKPPPQ